MNLILTILVVIVILSLVGSLPTWPYSAQWGYGPSGGMGVLLLILILIIFFGGKV